MESLAEERWARCVVPPAREAAETVLRVRALKQEDTAIQRRLLRRWLNAAGLPPEGVSFELVERLRKLLRRTRGGSASLTLPGGWRAVREYDRLRLAPASRMAPDVSVFRRRVMLRGETLVPELNLRIEIRCDAELRKQRPSQPGRLPAYASLSRRAVGRRRLYVRTWKSGDRMRALGLKGSKKLQDIFTDAKVPAAHRHTIPVFECGGEIVWIPGYRVAQGWHIPSPQTPAIQLNVHSIQ